MTEAQEVGLALSDPIDSPRAVRVDTVGLATFPCLLSRAAFLLDKMPPLGWATRRFASPASS
jgi:hypothetical protein